MVPYIIAGLLIFLICYGVIHQYGFQGTLDGISNLLKPVIAWMKAQWQLQRLSPLQQAKLDYHTSLHRLKNEPTNADLRMKTLDLGRSYFSLTRKDKKVTIFDEAALNNDISAACAGASATTGQQSSASTEERLYKLKALHDKGLVSNEEYAAQRQKILNEV